MAVERFGIQIAKEVLDDLKYRLDHILWPDQLGKGVGDIDKMVKTIV